MIATIGQVAQLVEHGPEKAGVGGSSPPLTTLSLLRVHWTLRTPPNRANSGHSLRTANFRAKDSSNLGHHAIPSQRWRSIDRFFPKSGRKSQIELIDCQDRIAVRTRDSAKMLVECSHCHAAIHNDCDHCPWCDLPRTPQQTRWNWSQFNLMHLLIIAPLIGVWLGWTLKASNP